jgi:putative DNA primase/helicase
VTTRRQILRAFTVGDPGNLTDVGNTARFARDHHGDVVFCGKLGWLCWDSAPWQVDETGEVERRARETVRAIYREAAEMPDEGERKRRVWWATDSESRSGIRAMLDLAQSEVGIARPANAFDRHPWLFNTLSGILDLTTGELAVHDPSALITKIAPTFYSPHAACPRFLAFLDRVMDGRGELVDFLRRAVGYSLTGDTREQVLFLLHGPGANGKSVFLEVIRSILGDYAANTPAETLMAKSGNSGIPNDVARLRSVRFVTAVETDDGRRLAEGLVKQMTGGDTLTARFLHREFFEFRPEFKVWLATNHLPTMRGNRLYDLASDPGDPLHRDHPACGAR